MSRSISTRRTWSLCAGLLGALTLAVMPLAQASAADSVVYDNIQKPTPGNVDSEGFEATSTNELGDGIQLAGTVRTGLSTTVLMSSWGCQSGHWSTNDCATTPGATFSTPITLHVYAVNPDKTPGATIDTITQTFAIPYRPSKSPECTGANAGKWYSAADATCYNGYATPITFNASTATWPDKVIVSVAYNTSTSGYSPIGTSASCYSSSGGCGYDSLNVGLNTDRAETVGTNLDESDAYVYGTNAVAYCDGGSGGLNSFRRDSSPAPYCWSMDEPAIRVFAAHTSPDNADQCKKDGYKQFSDPAFKNQGDCVSYAQKQKH